MPYGGGIRPLAVAEQQMNFHPHETCHGARRLGSPSNPLAGAADSNRGRRNGRRRPSRPVQDRTLRSVSFTEPQTLVDLIAGAELTGGPPREGPGMDPPERHPPRRNRTVRGRQGPILHSHAEQPPPRDPVRLGGGFLGLAVGEPRRDCRRLHSLRGWGHGTKEQVFPGDPGSHGGNGPPCG